MKKRQLRPRRSSRFQPTPPELVLSAHEHGPGSTFAFPCRLHDLDLSRDALRLVERLCSDVHQKPVEAFACYRDVTLQPGQLLASIRALADRYGLTEKVVQRALDELRKAGAIETTTVARFGTIITLLDYPSVDEIGALR